MSNFKIELENIEKTYLTKNGPLIAVTDVNFGVEENDFVTLVGPSGCGKSTIIRMLGGIITPTKGKIIYSGKEYTNGIPREEQRNLGFIFQSHNLLPWFTIRKNLELPLNIFNLTGEKWQKSIESLLQMVNLSEHAESYPTELSGGMQQRVGVIRAMVHNPEILLMDEPFGELDAINREQLDIELLSIWEKTKKTIIFITHNVSEAILLSSRVLVMSTNPGRIIEEVKIDLPRPRSLEMMNEERFLDYEEQITNLIGELNLEMVE